MLQKRKAKEKKSKQRGGLLLLLQKMTVKLKKVTLRDALLLLMKMAMGLIGPQSL